MAVSERLKAFLSTAKVKYTAAKHSTVYTAQEIAASQHVPGRQLAKCVLVLTNQDPVLAVLPAIHLIDFKKLKALLGTKTVSLAKEADIRQRFPDIEVGAMSPFGNLYQLSVVMDRALSQAPEIVFNAGTHTDTIKMRYQDVVRLVKPKVGEFGQPFSGPAPKKKKATSAGRSKQSSKKRPARPRAARAPKRRTSRR